MRGSIDVFPSLASPRTYCYRVEIGDGHDLYCPLSFPHLDGLYFTKCNTEGLTAIATIL